MRTAARKRRAVATPVRQQIAPKTFPAPVRGWVLNENLATAGPSAARQLDNWFPTTTGIRVRGGCKQVARVATAAPCYSLFNYVSSATEKLFGASATAIYDITAPADVNVVPTAAVSGQTSGYYSTQQYETPGGKFLYAVNGTDKAQLFNGTTWTQITGVSSPAITGVDTAKFSFVWAYGNRIWFVEKGSMNAWYLPVDSIAGAANSVSMAGIFQEGGSLLFGGTWSLDAGDGLDDKIVFVSDRGEVAVYEGNDPSSSSTWSKVGVYRITAPMGMNAVISAGGDLLVACEDGVVPISEAVNKDPAALSLAAVSKAIEPYWNTQVSARRTLPWEMLKWPSNNMMVVSQPVTFEGQEANCLVANLETGAWCRFTGWDTRCLGFHKNYGYFGTRTGEVYQMEVGGKDGTLPYTAVCVGQFDHMGSVGTTKTVRQARASFIASSPFIAKVSASVNYAINITSAPSSTADYLTSEWDVAKWDVSKWDNVGTTAYSSKWVSIGKTGYAFAPQVQITCGVTPLPRVELVSIDFTYEGGGLVV